MLHVIIRLATPESVVPCILAIYGFLYEALSASERSFFSEGWELYFPVLYKDKYLLIVRNYISLGKWRQEPPLRVCDLIRHGSLARFTLSGMNSLLLSRPYFHQTVIGYFQDISANHVPLGISFQWLLSCYRDIIAGYKYWLVFLLWQLAKHLLVLWVLDHRKEAFRSEPPHILQILYSKYVVSSAIGTSLQIQRNKQETMAIVFIGLWGSFFDFPDQKSRASFLCLVLAFLIERLPLTLV